MSTPTFAIKTQDSTGEYALATGSAAVRRMLVLHQIYSPTGCRLLRQAGLQPGMQVADFGCGVGAMTRTLAQMVGPSGSVTGIDVNPEQLEQAEILCTTAGLHNVMFRNADACDTGLRRGSFDLVYCRFLLLHLTDPAACLREMRDLLRPNGILVVEDGDLASADSVPRTALAAFADLFCRLGPKRGLNYSVANDLYHMVKEAGFKAPSIQIHQPADCAGPTGVLLTWSVIEAGPSFVSAGLITPKKLTKTVSAMEEASNNPNVLALAPRMSVVWANKAMVGES